MRLLKILIILPLLIYGAAMGYLWYEVKSNTDNIIQSTAHAAQISYGSIHISPMGDEIGLNDVVIRPVITTDEFRLEKLRITAPHIGYFIDTASNMKRGKPPEHLSIGLQRIHLDIGGEFFTLLDQMQEQAQAQAHVTSAGSGARAQGSAMAQFITSLDTLGCGEVERFTIGHLRGMGIGNITADIGFNLEYNPLTNHTLIKIDVRADRIYDMAFGIDLAMRPDAMASAMNVVPPKINISYHDTGFHKLRNKYCAALNGTDEAQYVDNHIQELSKKLGATFPEEVVTAYREAMAKGGRYTVHFDPSSELNIANLPYYKGADIAAMLGFSMRINETKVDLEQVQWGNVPTSVSTAQPSTPDAASNTDVVAPPRPVATGPSTQKKPLEPVFKTVAIADAGKYVNKMAEVTTYEGKVRSGKISEVSNGRIYLIIRVSAGTLTYPVNISDINKLKIRL